MPRKKIINKPGNKNDKTNKNEDFVKTTTNGCLKNSTQPSSNGNVNDTRNVKFGLFIEKDGNNKNRKKGKINYQDSYQSQGNGLSSSSKMHKSPSANTLSRLDRQDFVLWKRPFRTLKFFILEVISICSDFIKSLLYIRRLLPTIFLIIVGIFIYYVPGLHTSFMTQIKQKLLWCLYWIGLGVLSSVGLGTGLHTFLLYLGPHIARVTLAAFECNSLDFPEPPYPDDVTCPSSTNSIFGTITLWAIISKVRLESLMWGAGTALGELPPYFMARAARISGEEPDDEEYREFLAFVHGDTPKEMTLIDKAKLWMEQIVTRAGFPGILLFASIPNPFFDLAGITCGHFLIPFWTFFGATLIGKAFIKMHMQMLFVVLTFSEHHVEHLVNLLKKIPRMGPYIQAPLMEFLQAQKLRLHRNPSDPIPEQASSLLQQVMSYVIFAMILWFVISLINSLAQQYHKRLWENEKKKMRMKIH